MSSIQFPPEFGYFAAVVIAFWIQQSVIFVIPVAIQRNKTGIKPPVLYPNDSLIKELKLTTQQVEQYMCAQRVHQQNMEFLCTFIPIFFLAGFQNPLHTAIAGAIVWVGRLISAIGYWYSPGARIMGAWFHIPEFYILYLAGYFAFELISKIGA